MTVRHNLPVAYEDLPGNRSSVVVTVGDGWRAYQPFSLPGWDFVGVIQYHGVIGALGQSWTSGSYALHSDDRVRMLDSAEVEQALLQADVWRPISIIGDPMFKPLRTTALCLAALSSSASWSALPESGMWSFDGELNGKPGRGLQIDRQGGSTVIVTYFGYRPDGSAMFLQASGELQNDRLFRGDLMEFRNGRTVGGPPQSAEPEKYHGEIKIDFANTTSGTVQLPNDGARPISRFVFENNLHWFNNEFRIMIGPNKQAVARFDINGDRMKLTYQSQAIEGPDSSTAGSCKFDGSFERSGRGYRSEGTIACIGNLTYTGPYRIEDLAVDEYGALTGRTYENVDNSSFTLLTGMCMRSWILASPPFQCVDKSF